MEKTTYIPLKISTRNRLKEMKGVYISYDTFINTIMDMLEKRGEI